MVRILLKGHDFKHDLFELVRVFFPKKEIIFIENFKEYDGKGYLIESISKTNKKKQMINTNLYYNNKELDNLILDIGEINIGIDNLERIRKVGIKKLVYDILSKECILNPVWGILTGIRPVKLVHELIDLQVKNKEILKILTKEYKLDLTKAQLILRIALSQRYSIYPLDKKLFNLYVSIPFCPTRCIYCSFPSLPVKKFENKVSQYIDTLIFELKKTKEIMAGYEINTVYVGGGTPTSISSINLEKIIKTILKLYGKENIKELTVEAGRPDTLNQDMLLMLKRNGVNRISINPQTMNNKTLDIIGRNHSREDTINAYNLARKLKFDNINMDIIVGLPGEDKKDIVQTLKDIESLNPESLTVHHLAIKRASRFKEEVDKHKSLKKDTFANLLDNINRTTQNIKLSPYYLYRQKQISGNLENIGYSKKDKECIYNIAIMEEKQTIIGAGMGAVSKIFDPETGKVDRVPNFKSLNDYIERVDELIEKKKRKIDKLGV